MPVNQAPLYSPPPVLSSRQALSRPTKQQVHLRQHLAAARRRREAWRAAAAPELPDLDALLGDLDLPEIDADLASLQTEQGAVFDVSAAAQPSPPH